LSIKRALERRGLVLENLKYHVELEDMLAMKEALAASPEESVTLGDYERRREKRIRSKA
jgi:hypothetical protein